MDRAKIRGECFKVGLAGKTCRDEAGRCKASLVEIAMRTTSVQNHICTNHAEQSDTF